MPAALRNHAASAIAADEIFRTQRATVVERNVDAVVLLHEARDFPSAIDRHAQLADPLGQDALDVVLPESEHIVVPSGKVADVEREQVEAHGRMPLSLRDEPIRDAALIEYFDRA